jgi:hypothetical protein
MSDLGYGGVGKRMLGMGKVVDNGGAGGIYRLRHCQFGLEAVSLGRSDTGVEGI